MAQIRVQQSLTLPETTLGVESDCGAAQPPSLAHSGALHVTKLLCVVLFWAPVALFLVKFGADEPGKLPEVFELYTTCSYISTILVYKQYYGKVPKRGKNRVFYTSF